MDLVQGFMESWGRQMSTHDSGQVRFCLKTVFAPAGLPMHTHRSAYWVPTLLLCLLSTLVSPVPNTSSLPDLELRLCPFSAMLSESSGTLPAQGLLLSVLVPTTSAQHCLPMSFRKVEF